MSFAYLAGKPAYLPMELYEAEQFLYDLGLDGPGAAHHVENISDFYDFPIDWGTDFRLMNRLMQRISDLGESREALKAWCCAHENCTAVDALRASYNIHSITFFPGMDSDEELGEFALENELLEEFNALPDEIYEALDKAKAGAKMREMEGGVFANGGYLLVGNDFSGEPIPEEELFAHFQVRFSDGKRDSGWCDVPLTEADERLVARVFGCDDLSCLPMECRSIIPQLNGMFSGADELPALNLLSEALGGMSGEEIQKYKALLEVTKPGGIDEAFRLAETLNLYDVALEYADPAVYGRQAADRNYNLDENCPLLDYVDLAGYGAELLRAEGYEATRYGAVLLEPKQELALENHGFGGMAY